MLLEIMSQKITDEDRAYGYYYLNRHTGKLIKELTSLSMYDVGVLIRLELEDKKRMFLLKRLVGRYFNMKKQRELGIIKQYCNGLYNKDYIIDDYTEVHMELLNGINREKNRRVSKTKN